MMGNEGAQNSQEQGQEIVAIRVNDDTEEERQPLIPGGIRGLPLEGMQNVINHPRVQQATRNFMNEERNGIKIAHLLGAISALTAGANVAELTKAQEIAPQVTMALTTAAITYTGVYLLMRKLHRGCRLSRFFAPLCDFSFGNAEQRGHELADAVTTAFREEGIGIIRESLTM